MTVPEISAAELLRQLESDAKPQVLDIRAPERACLGHVEADDYFNVPGSRLSRLDNPRELGLDPERPVAVVCDRGISSRPVALRLLQLGFDASSLSGGMLRFMLSVVPREVPGVAGLDRLIQFDRVGKGALGYLAIRGDEALAVDAGRDLEPWNDALRAAKARLTAVVDTHCHADYLSGGPALARAHGAAYRLHPADAVDPYDGRPSRIPYLALDEGDTLAIGDATFSVEHLPGHTDGSVAVRLGDELVFTGDLLFVGSVGRPDLADRSAEWTARLWQSLERVRRAWPDRIRLFPAHYAGDDERTAGRIVEATLRELRVRNAPFAHADPAAFRAWIDERRTSFPEAYRHLKRANLGLLRVDEALADELEAGKNQCAVTP